jgi:hypothetical protein
MLHVILISLFVGAVIGAAIFYFGHLTASKYWKEVVFMANHAKEMAEAEVSRLKNKL